MATGPASQIPPDHYGCGLRCNRFTGTLAAFEEHERGYARALERLLPERLDCDICGHCCAAPAPAFRAAGGPQTRAYQANQARRRRRGKATETCLRAFCSIDEITPLESAERYSAPSQKPPTSKQSTSPAASASAPPLSSASIDPTPLFLNLLPINPPSQTGESNSFADKTIDHSHKEKVL